MSRRLSWQAAILCLLLAPPLAARADAPREVAEPEAAPGQEPDPTPDTDPTLLAVLDTIVVTGEQPGPGLWKVTRDGRTLWVLATVSPLPRRMEWNSLDIERRIEAAGVVILPPTVGIQAKGAALGGIFLLPRLMSARNNPGKEKLQDVLPPADYARWQALKARYLGRDRGVEKRRPMIAAMDLRSAALDHHDLTLRDVVGRVVRRAADRADVPVQVPEVTLVVEDPKEKLKEFAASPMDDLACFRVTLDQVERDLGTLAQRANAWATGDVATLASLPWSDNARACRDAMLQGSLAERSGFAALPARVEAAWLEQAEKALATHAESFAVLPIQRVVGPRGYLAALAAKGYQVEAPE